MEFDFSFYLTAIVIVLGFMSAVDIWVFLGGRNHSQTSLAFQYARKLFPIFFVVWLIRSFVVQPYQVPTGSLEPTVLPGDFIAVSQLSYGIRFPVTHRLIFHTGEPKRGDIAVFRWPKDPNIVFVKRVIGLPGDHIVYKDRTLYINGKKQSQVFLKRTIGQVYNGNPKITNVYEENLNGIKHLIYLQAVGGKRNNYELTVPKHHYFMMGDNRDTSIDSREWGYIPEANLVGRAFGIWMSWDYMKNVVRWHRIGNPL